MMTMRVITHLHVNQYINLLLMKQAAKITETQNGNPTLAIHSSQVKNLERKTARKPSVQDLANLFVRHFVEPLPNAQHRPDKQTYSTQCYPLKRQWQTHLYSILLRDGRWQKSPSHEVSSYKLLCRQFRRRQAHQHVGMKIGTGPISSGDVPSGWDVHADQDWMLSFVEHGIGRGGGS